MNYKIQLVWIAVSRFIFSFFSNHWQAVVLFDLLKIAMHLHQTKRFIGYILFYGFFNNSIDVMISDMVFIMRYQSTFSISLYNIDLFVIMITLNIQLKWILLKNH